MSHRAGEQYEVQRGDTVLRIAQAFGTLTSNVVTEDHKLPDPYKLFPGQKLLVLEREAVRHTHHKVVAGETLRTIAQQHEISLQSLQAVNPDTDPVRLVPGQILCLPEHGGMDMTSIY